MTTAATQTNPRQLPAWGASTELVDGTAHLRRLVRYAESDIGLLDALLRQSDAEGVDATRTWLNTFIEDSELQALMRGESFSIGHLIARACVFEAGSKIHLQLQNASADAVGLEARLDSRFNSAPQGFRNETQCSRRGSWLLELDRKMFHIVTTTTQASWGRSLRRTPLGCEEALGLICSECLSNVHAAGVTALCPHALLAHTCAECDTDATEKRREIAEKRWFVSRTVRVLVGDIRTAPDLRKTDRFGELQALLREHLQLDTPQELARALGWHVHTLTAIV